MSLPDLSNLTSKPHNSLSENAGDGVYCLDHIEDLKSCKSSVIIMRNAVPFSREDTQELDEFMSERPRTKNRYGTYNNRIQTTFGAAYDFGQESSIVPRNFSILRKPNDAEIESQRSEFERKREERYQKVAQKAAEAGKPTPPRAKTAFSPHPIKLHDVKLGHGDVLIMQGEMQRHFLHSVATDSRKALENARRMNLTVRAFKETVEA